MKFHSYLRWLFSAILVFNSLLSFAQAPYFPGGCGYNLALYADQLLTPGASEPGHQVQALGNYCLHQTPAHDFIGVNRLTDGLALTGVEHITNFSDGDFYTWADAASSSISIDGSGNGPGSYTLTPEAHNNIVLKNEPDPLATTDSRFFIYVSPNQPIEQFHVTLLGVNPSHVVWIVNGSIEFSGPAEIPGLLICNGTATFSGLTTYTPALWIRDKAIFSTVSGSGPVYTTSCLKSLNQQSYDSGKTMLQTLFGRDNSVFLHSDYASSYNPLTVNYRSSMHSGGSNLYPSDSLLVGSGTSVTNMDKEVDSLMTVMDSNMLRTYAISSGAGGRLNPGIYNVDGGSNLSNFHLTGDDRSIYIFLMGGSFNPDQMDYGLVKPENVYFYGKTLTISSPTSARGVFVAGGISIYAPDIQAALYAGGGISIASTRARAYGPRGKVLNIHLAPSNSLAKLNDSTLSLCASSGAVPVSITTSFATSLRVQSLQDTTVTSDQTYALSDSASEITTVYISEAATSLRLVGTGVDDTLRKPDITIQRRPSGVLTSLFPMIGALDSVSGNYRVADTSGFQLTAFADTTGLDSLVWNFSTGEKRVTASNTLTHPPLLWMQTIMAGVQAYRDGCPSVERSIGYSGGYPEPVDQPQVGLQILNDAVIVFQKTGNAWDHHSYDPAISPDTFSHRDPNRLPNQIVSAKYGSYEFMPYTRMLWPPGNPGIYTNTDTVPFENSRYDQTATDGAYTVNTSLFFHDRNTASCFPPDTGAPLTCAGNTISKKEAGARFNLYWNKGANNCYGATDFYYRFAYPNPSTGFKNCIEYSQYTNDPWDGRPEYAKLETSNFSPKDTISSDGAVFSKIKFKFRASAKGASTRLHHNAYLQLFRWCFPSGTSGVVKNDIVGTSPSGRFHTIHFKNPTNPNEYLVVVLIKPRNDNGFFGVVGDLATSGGLQYPNIRNVNDQAVLRHYWHDTALVNTYQVVYNWSSFEGRKNTSFSSDLETASGGISFIERNLEIRIFSAPISEPAFNSKLISVMSDVLDEIRQDVPFTNDFPLRGPVATAFVAQTENDTSHYNNSSPYQLYNPNRYLGTSGYVRRLYSNYAARTINLASWDTLRKKVIEVVTEACSTNQRINGSGVIVWNLEGEPTQHPEGDLTSRVSYVGDLKHVLTGDTMCKELLVRIPGRSLRLIDMIFDTIRRGYHLVPGILIRPQRLVYDASLGPRSTCQRQVPFSITKYMSEAQRADTNQAIAELLASKMFYAYSQPYTYDSAGTTWPARWGVRIFYVDSPYTWDLQNWSTGLGFINKSPIEPIVYTLAREKFRLKCQLANIPYLPIAIIPESGTGGSPQDFGLLASTFPYVQYFTETGGLYGRDTKFVSDIAKKLYPHSAIFVDFSKDGVSDPIKSEMRGELRSYFRDELLSCNHISCYRGWYGFERDILKEELYTPTILNSTLGGCFLNGPDSTILLDASTRNISFNCKPKIILDNGGYGDYLNSSNDTLRIALAPSQLGRRPVLDLINGRLDVRANGSVADSLTIWARTAPLVKLDKATGTHFSTYIETETNVPLRMNFRSDATYSAPGFAYKLSCRSVKDPIITRLGSYIALEGCTLRIYGHYLDSCKFGLNSDSVKSPYLVAPDGTWADIILPKFGQPRVRASIFDGSYVYVHSLRSGLTIHSQSKLLIRRGNIQVEALPNPPCQAKQLQVKDIEINLFSAVNLGATRAPYYRWYRFTDSSVAEVSGSIISCRRCFTSDGRSNQYLFIDGVGEFRIRRRIDDSRVELYASGDTLVGSYLIGKKVSVGGNENLEGRVASVTIPGNYWCFDAVLGGAGYSSTQSHLNCPLSPIQVEVTPTDVTECAITYAKLSSGKSTATSTTSKLDLKKSAYTFELFMRYDGGSITWDTTSHLEIKPLRIFLNLGGSLVFAVDRFGHLNIRSFYYNPLDAGANTTFTRFISRSSLVPGNTYHVSITRQTSPDHRLFIRVVPVSSQKKPYGDHDPFLKFWKVGRDFGADNQVSVLPIDSFSSVRAGFSVPSTTSLTAPGIESKLTISGMDSLLQIRGLRLWKGARTEEQTRTDALSTLSGEDVSADSARLIFEYRFLTKAGENVIRTTPQDPDLVLPVGGLNQPILKYSSCGMAHPGAALAGPDEYLTRADTINLSTATRDPNKGIWVVANGLLSSGRLTPTLARPGDNYFRYSIDSLQSTSEGRKRCNVKVPLFRKVHLPPGISTPGDSGLNPYPWKLYKYLVDGSEFNPDSISYVWHVREGGQAWQLVDSGSRNNIQYAWVYKDVVRDSVRVKLKIRSHGQINAFVRKLEVKPRYAVELFGLQSADTSAIRFDSLRTAVLTAQLKYPQNNINGHLPKAVFKTCGGGAFRYRMHVRWIPPRATKSIIRGYPAPRANELRGRIDSLMGVPSSDTLVVGLYSTAFDDSTGAFARSRTLLLPSPGVSADSLTMKISFRFFRDGYKEYALPIHVVTHSVAAPVPMNVSAVCFNGKPRLVVDSLSPSTLKLWASRLGSGGLMPNTKAALDTTWSTGAYQAYAFVNGQCKADTFGIFNGFSGIVRDTVLKGTVIVMKDLAVSGSTVRLAQNARLYMMASRPLTSHYDATEPAAASPGFQPYHGTGTKLQELSLADSSRLELEPGSTIQGICNMWGSLDVTHPSRLVAIGSGAKPTIADAYRGLRLLPPSGAMPEDDTTYIDNQDSRLTTSATTSNTPLRGIRFLNNRVCIDDGYAAGHAKRIADCDFVAVPGALKPPYKKNHQANYDFIGYKAVHLRTSFDTSHFGKLRVSGYQFGVVQMGTNAIEADSCYFANCGAAAIFSRAGRIRLDSAHLRLLRVGDSTQIRAEKSGTGDIGYFLDTSHHVQTGYTNALRPYGIFTEGGSEKAVSVNMSRFEGSTSVTSFSSLVGTGVRVGKSPLDVTETRFHRLETALKLENRPLRGYQSIHGASFLACETAILAGSANQTSSMNIDLSCSIFEPGDTLPDYSTHPNPTIRRRLSGNAYGIAIIGIVNNIGKYSIDSSGVVTYSPGANVFPTAAVNTDGNALYRNVLPKIGLPPNDEDVDVDDEANSKWDSPDSWTSLSVGSSSPTYYKWKNEYTKPWIGLVFIQPSPAAMQVGVSNDTTDPNYIDCGSTLDPVWPNTRVRSSQTLISSVSALESKSCFLSCLPNPADKKVSIVYRITVACRQPALEIFQLGAGSSIKRLPLTEMSGTIEVNLSQYPSGLFGYRIVSEGTVLSSKRMAVTH